MKVLFVLLGLVALACSQMEDVETLKAQVMTALIPELMKLEYNSNQAENMARFLVEDNESWRDLMKYRSNHKSNFLSPDNLQQILEEIIPRDEEHIMMYGTRAQPLKTEDDDDE
ncbi:hypothetical protein ACJMK2_038871 [Sinanodonta woodiana]|uniref:Uncharacterized protein n=1 Tax=Sinanodonta woodiana TaxID=1069815 RepID=A0ABD3WAA3_SINWO